jgi:hypothetical protein
MPRGITEHDVWTACDALLLAGERPTIERVRQKIGRGSPNTVSPMLDAWFKGLGARITDPGAFAAAPGVPDTVLQAAKHFWEAALAVTRGDFDERLREGMAAAVANVEAEKERAATAEAAAYAAAAKLTRADAEMAERGALLERERAGRAADSARLEEAKAQIERLVSEARQAAAEAAQARTQARSDIEAAQQRSAAAERRAALEIDAERVARAKADKRVEAAEVRADAALTKAREADVARLEAAAQLQSLQARSDERIGHLEGALAQEHDGRLHAEARLADALDRAKSAEIEVAAIGKVLAQFNANAPKKVTARRSPASSR